MVLPESLGLLFDWLDAQGLVHEVRGRHIATLYPEDGPDLGTNCWFLVHDEERARGNADSWLRERSDLRSAERLRVFAKTGRDGSKAALWLDDGGTQHIVHLGSGSGSTMTCVLTHDAVDFLRLLAIGYDELCWSQSFDEPPASVDEDGFLTWRNEPLRAWVEETFGVSIPETAAELVGRPADMADENSDDPFWHWLSAR